jgi:hypothetical protein
VRAAGDYGDVIERILTDSREAEKLKLLQAEQQELRKQQQQQQQAAASSSVATNAAAAAAAPAAVASVGAATRKRLCPDDAACAKLNNPTHMRLFAHTCRAPGGPGACHQRHDVKHTEFYLHPVPAPPAGGDAASPGKAFAADVAAGDGLSDSDDDALMSRRATAAAAAAADEGAWVDLSDPWAVHPRGYRAALRRADRQARLQEQRQRKQLPHTTAATAAAAQQPQQGAASPAAAGKSTATWVARGTFGSSDDEDHDGAHSDSDPDAVREVVAASKGKNDAGAPRAAGHGGGDDDGVLKVLEARVPLRCPLSYQRIKTPARGRRCRHDACFDLATFIAASARHSTWNCPLCDGPAYVADLRCDSLVAAALDTLPDADFNHGVDALLISGSGADRTWRYVEVNMDTISTSEDDDDDGAPSRRPPQPTTTATTTGVDISQGSGGAEILVD